MAFVNRFPYRTEEDVIAIVRWAMSLQGVFAMHVEPGVVKIHRNGPGDGGDPPVEPEPALPSDDLFERIRQGPPGFGLGHLSAPNRRDALMVAMAFCQHNGLFPTHLLCHSKDDLCGLLVLPRLGEKGLADSRTVFGWEVVADQDVPQGTIFLCAGPRRGGVVSDVSAAIRLEGSDES